MELHRAVAACTAAPRIPRTGKLGATCTSGITRTILAISVIHLLPLTVATLVAGSLLLEFVRHILADTLLQFRPVLRRGGVEALRSHLIVDLDNHLRVLIGASVFVPRMTRCKNSRELHLSGGQITGVCRLPALSSLARVRLLRPAALLETGLLLLQIDETVTQCVPNREGLRVVLRVLRYHGTAHNRGGPLDFRLKALDLTVQTRSLGVHNARVSNV